MGEHAQPRRRERRRRPAARAAVLAAAVVGAVSVAAALLTSHPTAPSTPGAPPVAALPAPTAASTDDPGGTDTDGADTGAAEHGGDPAVEPVAHTIPAASRPAAVRAPAAHAPAGKPAPAGAVPPPAGGAATPAAMVDGTPCTAAAKACVDIDAGQAWLIKNGAVTRGPVGVMTGDRDDPTPVGTFKVQWKAEQYTSRQYLTQMPYSVFFADGGVAFHEGEQDTYSAGCVKLTHDDAVAWFNYLQVGDEVQVH